jgi:hypothetical protein
MWEQRAISDRGNPELYDIDGNHRAYEELARAGRSYAREASLEHLTEQSRKVQAALDRLAADLTAARPDVVLIVGDDQHELFDAGNLPAIQSSMAIRLSLTPSGSVALAILNSCVSSPKRTRWTSIMSSNAMVSSRAV